MNYSKDSQQTVLQTVLPPRAKRNRFSRNLLSQINLKLPTQDEHFRCVADRPYHWVPSGSIERSQHVILVIYN